MSTFPYPENRTTWLCNVGIRLAVSGALSLLSACQQLSDSFEETRNPRPQEQQGRAAAKQSGSYSTSTSVSGISIATPGKEHLPGSFFETSVAGWDSIQQKLNELPGFRDKKLFLYQGFYVYDYQGGIIGINIQDPGNKEHIDAYRYYNGKWEQQGPVKISGNMPEENFLMPLEKVKFSTIRKIWNIAKERAAAIPGAASATHIYFEYMKRPPVKQWYLSIPAPRRDYFLEFDPEGNLKKVR